MYTSISHLPVMVVDDEPQILDLTKMTLGGEGFTNLVTIEDSRQVIPRLQREKISAIILDLMMPQLSGTELLTLLAADFPTIPVIIMTAMDDVETAVDCLKTGAFDYLVKPVDPNRLLSVVQKALKMSSLETEISSLKDCLLTDHLADAEAFSEIITCNKKMRGIFQYAEVIAKSRQPLLITGETGVGKDLMAAAIHKLSGVRGQFVTVNAAGLDDFTFSDALFGHKRGAYTGAETVRDGLIRKATHGTLFLDEIGDLSQKSQTKLLRLLQSQEYYPLGSDILKTSDARVIVATNHDLERLIEEGKFRKDLYYRLCSYQLHIPPLRERTDDIPLLLDYFVEESAESLQKEKPKLPLRLVETLSAYSFPGNVRELKAMVNDAVARDKTGILTNSSFPCTRGINPAAPLALADPSKASDAFCRIFGKFPTIEEVENYMVKAAMEMAEQRRTVAASLLGMTRQALYKKLKKNGDASPEPLQGEWSECGKNR